MNPSLLQRIEKVLSKGKDEGSLNNWESSFIDSIGNQLVRNPERELSQKQLNWFQKIEAKVLSNNPKEWLEGWNEEKAKKLAIAVSYYEHTEYYFADLVQWVKDNPTKIISERNYKKLVENKYAQKIINALEAEPLYPAGSNVLVRSNSTIPPHLQSYRGELFFVIKPLNRAISAANGCRLYLVLSSKSSETFEIEERWIKKNKKNKKS